MNNRIVDQAGIYTDISAVHKLRSSSVDKDDAIRETSKQFESFMTSMMIKSMRQVNAVFEKGNPFHDNASNVYRDMLDQQMSLNMSSKGSMGLADMLARQLGVKDAKPEVTLTESEKTALDRVTRYRGGGHLSASFLPNFPSNDSDKNLLDTGNLSTKPGLMGNPVNGVPASLDKSSRLIEDLPDTFESPEAFIDAVYPAAARVAGKMGIDPAVLVAQSALETGWGRHMIREPGGQPSHNLFGIKADRRWEGEVATVTTTEYIGGQAVKETAPFRAYASYEESFSDYLQFVKSQPRYETALASADDPAGYTDALQKAGYATDPAYAQKINQIFNSDAIQKARIEWMSRQDSHQNSGQDSQQISPEDHQP